MSTPAPALQPLALALQGTTPDVAAPIRLGMSAAAYRAMVEVLADQLATADDQDPRFLTPHQRAADLETAEWHIAVLYAAGYVPRRQRRPSR